MTSHCDCDIRRELRKIRRQLTRMETLIMTTKEETLAAMAELKSDTQRLIGDLQTTKDALLAAIEAGDMTAIKAAADDIDALVEGASPEPTEPPTEPTP